MKSRILFSFLMGLTFSASAAYAAATIYVMGPTGPLQEVVANTTTQTVCSTSTTTPGTISRKWTTKAAAPGGTQTTCTQQTVATYDKVWLHPDYQDSIHLVSKPDGSPALTTTYKPYGEPLSKTGSYAESLSYTGQRQDSSTGLFYLHARYYDPALSRFISPDPITPGKEIVKLNHYAYADNDPINNTDVSGMQSDPTWSFSTAAASTYVAQPCPKGTDCNPIELPGVTVEAKAPTIVEEMSVDFATRMAVDPKFRANMNLAMGATNPLYGATGQAASRILSHFERAGVREASIVEKTPINWVGAKQDVLEKVAEMKGAVERMGTWKREVKVLPMMMTHETEFFDKALNNTPIIAPVGVQIYRGKPFYSAPLTAGNLDAVKASLNTFFGGGEHMWMQVGKPLSPQEFIKKYYP
ncbi:MAG: RHS repeat-associated core domain-containing protein [Pseudomonadota bacterium]